MPERKDVTLPMPMAAVDQIDSMLEYGDSRAGWLREAAYQRLEREGVDTAEFRKQLGDGGEGEEENLNTAAPDC